jgi:hypothetical protein
MWSCDDPLGESALALTGPITNIIYVMRPSDYRHRILYYPVDPWALDPLSPCSVSTGFQPRSAWIWSKSLTLRSLVRKVGFTLHQKKGLALLPGCRFKLGDEFEIFSARNKLLPPCFYLWARISTYSPDHHLLLQPGDQHRIPGVVVIIIIVVCAQFYWVHIHACVREKRVDPYGDHIPHCLGIIGWFWGRRTDKSLLRMSWPLGLPSFELDWGRVHSWLTIL